MRYISRGDELLKDCIEQTPAQRIVEASLLGNSRAREFLGYKDSLPTPLLSRPPRKCDQCKEVRPPWEFEGDSWVCVFCDRRSIKEPLAESLTETHKWCWRCFEWQPKSDFSPKRDARDKLHPYCKRHRREDRRAAYQAKKRTAFAVKV